MKCLCGQGAGQCDTKKGTLVGKVIVKYAGGVATVTYQLNKGFEMTEVHVYIGTAKYPKHGGKNTVAPGQYTFNSLALNYASTYEVKKTIALPFYVIAHAVVCQIVPKAPKGSVGKLRSAFIPTSGLEASDLKVYPNPFSDKLNFEFISPESVNARIDLYDMTGRMVKTIFEQPIESGVSYDAEFKPETIISGMYFYRMTIGETVYNSKAVFKKE